MPYTDRAKANAASRASYRRHRESALASKRRWREANPEYMALYGATHREDKREGYYQRTYGISVADYEALLEAQGGGCATCGTTRGQQRHGTQRRLFIDHDAETGAVRGLLCSRCNSAIGYLDHRVGVVAAALAYLTNPPALAVLWHGKDEETLAATDVVADTERETA